MPKRLVYFDRPTEREPPLGSSGGRIAIRMQSPTQIAMSLLECYQVETKRGLEPQSLERVHSANREGVTATAARRFLRILELEPLKHQRLLVVEHRASQVHEALLVHVEAHAARVVYRVALARWRVFILNDVGKTRAAATLHAEPHCRIRSAARREFFLGKLHGLVRDGDLTPRLRALGGRFTFRADGGGGVGFHWGNSHQSGRSGTFTL